MGVPEKPNTIVACHECGQLVRLTDVPQKTIARCLRCNAKLLHRRPDTTDRTLALAITCLILLAITLVYPFLAMRIQGVEQQTNLVTGIVSLYHQDMPGLALLVMMTILVLPLSQILGLIYIYLPIRLGCIAWKTAQVFRAIRYLQPWGMMEVYMIGILVSMIKLAKMSTITPGTASWTFMALICTLTATFSGMNPDDVWKRLPVKSKGRIKKSSIKPILVGCHSCSLLCRISGPGDNPVCPRCQARLHVRKANSIHRTWALIAAAAIFYFPANLFPITITRTMAQDQADTILSGVIYFLFTDLWHIALIIFIASVLVPVLKILILVYLLISVQAKSKWKPKDRTRLYRITEIVGRWSMIDVYVVTILVALVQLGPLGNVTAGPGVIYFSAVVVITMFAANSFDPRLIWDAMEEQNELK